MSPEELQQRLHRPLTDFADREAAQRTIATLTAQLAAAEAKVALVDGMCKEHFDRAQSNIKEVARLNALAEQRRIEVATAIDLERSRTEHAINQQLLMERRAFAAEAKVAVAAEDERDRLYDMAMEEASVTRNGTKRRERAAWAAEWLRLNGSGSRAALRALTQEPSNAE